ncbi:uncharacterized protein J3R85_000276 [Psidium guajava]|nr:uncharacterized protein J3R85_000276 [Psidium guajava]
MSTSPSIYPIKTTSSGSTAQSLLILIPKRPPPWWRLIVISLVYQCSLSDLDCSGEPPQRLPSLGVIIAIVATSLVLVNLFFYQ